MHRQLDKKPAVAAKYLKHKIIMEGKHLYESVRVKGTEKEAYRWSKLPSQESISEDDASTYSSDFVPDTLNDILSHMLDNPTYVPTWLDYQSFYEFRTKYPNIWNRFIDVSLSRKHKSMTHF